MTGGRLPVLVWKELQALLPAWSAAMVVVGAGALMGGVLAVPALAAFAIGAVVLGAQAVGHEYSHGTLAALLAQPIGRRRVFAVKLGALALLLLPLTWTAWQVTFLHRGMLGVWSGLDRFTLLAVAPLALFVSPVLTMASRGVLAGAVFTLTVPVVLLIAGDLAGLVLHGTTAAAHVDAVRAGVFRWGLPVVCVLGAVAGWRAFVRLEASDAPRTDVQVRAWTSGAAAVPEPSRGHPLVRLAAKELRLQQLTLVFAGLYAALALTAASIEWIAPGTARLALPALTGLYVLVIPLLAGAMPSAEERQLGTHEWQLLMPMATRRQWAMKAGVSLVCALLLGYGLPVVVAAVHPGAAAAFSGPRWWELAAFIVLLTSCGLYVSSWSPNGVRALVSGLALTFGLLMFVSLVQTPVRALVLVLPRVTVDAASYRVLTSAIIIAVSLCLSAVLLRFGLSNHRSAHPGAAAIARQIIVILAIVAGGVLLLSLVDIAARPGARG
jgi:hypothetical protein